MQRSKITARTHHWTLPCKSTGMYVIKALPGQRVTCKNCLHKMKLEADEGPSELVESDYREEPRKQKRRWAPVSYQWKEWKDV